MQLNIHDQTLKRVGFINNNLPDALHYYDDNWHRFLAEGTSTFDLSVNKINSSYALLTLQSYISFTYDGEDYLFNIINIEQDHYSMHLQCENLNLELISEEVGAYGNTKRHSIVWYLKNAAKITDDLVEIGNNPFSLVDEDVSNPIISFDNDETKLSRIISICKSFNAEFQFKTQLKNDGTLQNITIDLYKEGGVGQKRKDVTLYYGKNIAGIASKADRTSTFFNATTVTDSKNKFNWLSVEGKHYNSDGQLEFHKNAGDNTAYAPLSRDMFPSQLKSSSSDRYTRKNLNIEATSANSLWDYAVSQFKLFAYPQMTYEVSVAVNAVTNALGNNRRLDIGDTITVQDNTFDKSEGGLILSARVSEQEISFTNPQSNKIIFTNFVRLKSDISADLYGRMKGLVDQATPYRFEIASDNGLTFKNSTGSTTLTALVFKGSNIDEVPVDSFEWLIDGVKFGGTAKSQLVSASQVTGTAVVRYNAKIGDTVIGGIEVTIQDITDGISPTVKVNPDTSLTIVDFKGTKTTPVLKGERGKQIFKSSYHNAPNSSANWWSDLSPAPSIDNPPKIGDTVITPSGNILQIDTVTVGGGGGGGTFGVGNVLGNIKGPSGTDGLAGKDGVGIKTTAITYAISASGTTAPSTGWTSSVPSLIKGQYLWTKTVWTYTDNSSETGYSVTYISKDGNNGTDGIAGKDGVGISNTIIEYVGAVSGTSKPTSGWNATIPSVAAGQYLWTRTTWKYTDGTSEQGFTNALMGLTGASGKDGLAGKDGVGIKSTQIMYSQSTSGTTAPTTGWNSQVPTLIKGQYLWTQTTWVYTDNSGEAGYTVSYISKDGNNGTNGLAGKDGVGIKTTTITYVGSTSGTTAPTSGWTSAVPTVGAGSYLWTKTVWGYTDNTSETGYSVARMGLKGDKGDPGIKGSDGTSGIIVSSVAPASPKTGQLWQDTSTTPQLVKKWTGSSWVIWEFYAQNLKADKLDSISGNLGTMIAGTIKIMADIIINAAGKTKKFGMLFTKKGLLSTGPTFDAAGQASDTKMAVASLTQGELRFINTDYNEDIEQVQNSGLSSANNGFIRFSNTAEKGDLLEISSGGNILLNGFTTQTNDWIKLTELAYYKVMFGRVNVRVGLTSGNSTNNIYLGTVPNKYKSPNGDMMLPAQAWSINLGLDRHVQYSTNGNLYLLNPEPNTKYVFEVSYTL